MRVFILILCFFVAFLTSANAEELYRCVDQSGNAIVTDRPQDGMENCVLNHADEEDSAAENQETEESESADRQEIIRERRMIRLSHLNKHNALTAHKTDQIILASLSCQQ